MQWQPVSQSEWTELINPRENSAQSRKSHIVPALRVKQALRSQSCRQAAHRQLIRCGHTHVSSPSSCQKW